MAKRNKHVDLDMNGQQVKNIGAPTDNGDAATKNYVDSAVSGTSGGSDSDFLKLDDTAPDAVTNDLYKTGRLCLGTNVPKSLTASLTVEGPNNNDSGLWFSKLNLSSPVVSASQASVLGVDSQGKVVAREARSTAILNSPIRVVTGNLNFTTSGGIEGEQQVIKYTGSTSQTWFDYRYLGGSTDSFNVLKAFIMEPADPAATVTIAHKNTSASGVQFSCPNDEDLVLRQGDRVGLCWKNAYMEVVWVYRHNPVAGAGTSEILGPMFSGADLTLTPVSETGAHIVRFTGDASASNYAWEGITYSGNLADLEDHVLVFIHEGQGIVDMYLGGLSTPSNAIPIGGVAGAHSLLSRGARVVFVVKNGVAEVISINTGKEGKVVEESYPSSFTVGESGILTSFNFQTLHSVIFYDEDQSAVVPESDIVVTSKGLGSWTFDYTGATARPNIKIYGIGTSSV